MDNPAKPLYVVRWFEGVCTRPTLPFTCTPLPQTPESSLNDKPLKPLSDFDRKYSW